MRTYYDVKEKLLEQSYQNKISMVGEFELSKNCNFNCEMCYAKSLDKNLSREEWIDIFKQAYNNGMLYALLTGGEVFLQPDFLYLYSYLFDLGVKISIYTNGSMLTDKILDFLSKKPPELIAITLYGYNETSYQKFTGTNSFKDVSRNIDKLLSNNLNVVLRTIPLPQIYNNLDKVINFAKEKQLQMSYFLYVSKTNDEVIRLNPEELLDFKNQMKKAFPSKTESSKSHYCSAFKNGFFVNHSGFMQGCAMMPTPSDKITNNFKELYIKLGKEWNELLKQSPCKNCSIKDNCFTCLARRYLEGNVFACSDYLKEFAEMNTK